DIARRAAIAAEVPVEIENRLAAQREMHRLAPVRPQDEAQVAEMLARLHGAPKADPGLLVDALGRIAVGAGGEQRGEMLGSARFAGGVRLRIAEARLHFPEAVRGGLGEVLEPRPAVDDLALGADALRNVAHDPQLLRPARRLEHAYGELGREGAAVERVGGSL